MSDTFIDKTDANLDPLSGAPGAHPVGVGVGAASAGVVGAVGRLDGRRSGRRRDRRGDRRPGRRPAPAKAWPRWSTRPSRPPTGGTPTSTRPYYVAGTPYEHYEPAYRYGWEAHDRYEGKRFGDVESDLERGWEKVKGNSSLAWEKAKHATRDAWDRVERALPGDSDRDGR